MMLNGNLLLQATAKIHVMALDAIMSSAKETCCNAQSALCRHQIQGVFGCV